jgi:hypothetical protein
MLRAAIGAVSARRILGLIFTPRAFCSRIFTSFSENPPSGPVMNTVETFDGVSAGADGRVSPKRKRAFWMKMASILGRISRERIGNLMAL